MGDAVRMCMSRSMHSGSPRRDNAEEVARRRFAMQREQEQRREEVRRLQEEKMARAAAQKEERLQKQRETQQREALRMQAAQKRRSAALAEEKMRKAAAMAKVEQAASRAQAQQKSRPVYAFGSSTPRELGYLTQLSKQQQVYDRKLQPASGGVSSPALNSNRRLSSAPRESQMTRSMYLPGSDASKSVNNRPGAAAMTRSVMTPQQLSRGSPKPQHTPRQTPVREVIARRSNGTTPAQRLGMVRRLPKTSTPIGPDATPPPISDKERNEVASAKPKAIKGGNKQKKSLDSAPVTEENSLENKHDVVEHVPFEEAVVATSVLEAVLNEEHKSEAEHEDKHPEPVFSPVEERSDAAKHLILEKEVVVAAAPESVSTEEQEEERKNTEKGVDEHLEPVPSPAEERSDAVEHVVPEKETAPEAVSNGEEEDKDEANVGERPEPMSSPFEESSEVAEHVVVEEEIAAAPKPESVEAVNKDAEEHVVLEKEMAAAPEPESAGAVNKDEKEYVVLEEEPVVTSNSESGSNEKEQRNEKTEILDGHPGPMSSPAPENQLSEAGLSDRMEQLCLGSTEEPERNERSKYEEAQREREERKARLAAIMSRTRGAPTAVVNPTTQNVAKESEAAKEPMKENGAAETQRFAAVKTASILQKLASSNPQLISSNPHLMSLLQRNGSNPSLAEELSAADRKSPSFGQSNESINGSNNVTIRPFEGDTETQRTVAMI